MMNRGLVRFLGAAACGAIQGTAALADGPVLVRSGDHPGFGRVVIDTSGDPHFKLEQSGSRVVVRLTPPVTLDVAPAAPHNVLSLQTSGPVLELTLAPGSSVRSSVAGGHVVIDVKDPPAPTATTPTATQAPTPAPAGTKAPADELAAPKKRKGWPIALPQTAMMRSPELAGRGRVNVPETAASATVPPAPPPAPTSPAPTMPPGVEAPVAATQTPPVSNTEAAGRAASANQPLSVTPRGPLDLLARSARLPQGGDGSAFIMPFAATTGAAAFRRNDDIFVVFDERRPVDLSSLREDPVFNHAQVRLLAAGTLLRLPMPTGLSVSLAPSQSGWRISASRTPPKLELISAIYGDGEMTLPAEQPGAVVAMADPASGATLLVGTTRGAGRGVALARRSADFILHPSSAGVVVEPLSDALTLKGTAGGFVLAHPPLGLAISSPQTAAGMADALSLTRRLNFVIGDPDSLLRRLISQIDEAAMAPAQARGPKRVAAALTMLSLGMAAEAQGLLRVATEGDPRLAASPDVAAFGAVAALLAGRATEADELDDPRLSGPDDIAFWRAVRQATIEEGSPLAAGVFASTAPLLSLYSKPMQARLLPLVAETLIQGGETAAADRLLADHPNDPKLLYARAMLGLKNGESDKALAMLDKLAVGHDQFDRARAAVRAVELRLAANQLTPAEAADTMDRLVYAWRGDQRELRLRQRIAELREQTGEWRTALATLRQAEADFPDQAPQIHTRLQDAFADMVSDPRLRTMPPIDVVSTIDENADLVAARQGDPRVQEQLADRLLALDLPGRAGPVLDKLMRSATTPLSKALYGANLAGLAVGEKNDAGALAALNASEASDLPAALAERRTLLRAETLAHAGDARAADTMLAALGTPAASQARASILEQAQDWAGAERAWTDYAAKSVPDSGTLDDDRARTLVRLATVTARAGDDAALSGLRNKYTNRLADGALADMFRLLTAEPVRGTSDLQRVRQDISLAQSLPANLRALYSNTDSPKN
jgi:hypothetical protein